MSDHRVLFNPPTLPQPGTGMRALLNPVPGRLPDVPRAVEREMELPSRVCQERSETATDWDNRG